MQLHALPCMFSNKPMWLLLLQGMLWETSLLDAEEGIRFRGHNIPELQVGCAPQTRVFIHLTRALDMPGTGGMV